MIRRKCDEPTRAPPASMPPPYMTGTSAVASCSSSQGKSAITSSGECWPQMCYKPPALFVFSLLIVRYNTYIRYLEIPTINQWHFHYSFTTKGDFFLRSFIFLNHVKFLRFSFPYVLGHWSIICTILLRDLISFHVLISLLTYF